MSLTTPLSTRHSSRLAAPALFAALLVWDAPLLAQPAGVSTFDVEIPAAPGNFGISRVGGIITFTDDPGSADITVSNEHGVSCTFSVGAGDAPEFQVFDPGGADCSGGSAQAVNDTATFTAPASGLPAGDPQGFRYRFDLFPNSNADFSTPGICPDASGGTDTWTITMDPASPTAASVCLISLNRSVAGAQCGVDEQEISSDSPSEVASVVIDGSPATALCGSQRPAADVMLVLDRSGSMDRSTLSTASRPKFAALRNAVSDFVAEWTALRNLESLTGDPSDVRNDNLGLVFFDADAASPVTVPLAGFNASSLSVLSETEAECNGDPATPDVADCSGSTSIGDGLEAAVSQLFSGGAAGNRKVVMLMSDGKQNTASRVTTDSTSDPTEVQLYETDPLVTTPLFGAGQAGTIYSITVGTSTAVSADLNEDIATATGGFYVNTEDDQEFVRPFFLEVLESFLRFNSWQTLRLASGTVETQAPLLVPFPVSTTTRAMTVNLLWDAGLGSLDATLLPPGYQESDAPQAESARPGAIRFSLPLPLDPGVTPNDDWVLRVRAVGVDGDANAPLRRPIPFHVTVTGEDAGLRGTLGVVAANYTPGDGILVTARIDNPETLTDLGAGATLEARVLQPGEAIGNVIAASDAQGDPSGDDPGSSADAKLEQILAQSPDALDIDEGVVALVDDGTGGDLSAGDGVFSGTIPTEAAGHYSVLISVAGQSARSGRFSRDARRSVHVRATPGNVATDAPVISTVDGGTQVLLTFTPTTSFGDAMPGFGPYFPITATGIEPVVPRDNLDGSYTATLVFPGDPPGDISINWIESSADLFGVPAASLPIGGPGGQVLVAGITIPALPGPGTLFYIVLLILFLLLALLVIRKLLRS